MRHTMSSFVRCGTNYLFKEFLILFRQKKYLCCSGLNFELYYVDLARVLYHFSFIQSFAGPFRGHPFHSTGKQPLVSTGNRGGNHEINHSKGGLALTGT